jgi:hypothetical protein
MGSFHCHRIFLHTFSARWHFQGKSAKIANTAQNGFSSNRNGDTMQLNIPMVITIEDHGTNVFFLAVKFRNLN